MNTRITIAAGILLLPLAGILTACGGNTPPTGSAAAATSEATTRDEQAVRDAFTGFNKAWLDRDYQAACNLQNPAEIQPLIDDVKKSTGVDVTCADALAVGAKNPDAAADQDNRSRTAQITGVRITGDTATLDYTETRDGHPTPGYSPFSRVNGKWLISDEVSTDTTGTSPPSTTGS